MECDALIRPNQNSLKGFEVVNTIKSYVKVACNATLSCTDILALTTLDGVILCNTFWTCIYNETNIDANFTTTQRIDCPASGGGSNLASLNQSLVAQHGLIHLDQGLFNRGSSYAFIKTHSNNYRAFTSDFAIAMLKMGNFNSLTGTNREIKRNCRMVN
ncbi:hypothetical protein BT93_L4316 [Corymbia citriodora subsp. variegata]|uniref:peroxidase n=1 Tax=Corymbia citriodora subsp. variegata TaxID=360336 RepID=A0A8T0CYR9_CORYI|nr:hypothetical protein BT93_L4316 [Corymbia citriodora subsp. variegata]